MTSKRLTIAAAALGLLALTGCSEQPVEKTPTADVAVEATNKPVPTKSPSLPPATETPAAVEQSPAVERFGAKASGRAVADEMRTFARDALAGKDLLSDKMNANAYAVKRLPLTADESRYLGASIEQASEVTSDTFTDGKPANQSTFRPAAPFGEIAGVKDETGDGVIDEDDLLVEVDLATYQGEDALVVRFSVVSRIFAEQRPTTTDAWEKVTYEATRDYTLTLVENPISKPGASAWVVADHDTTDLTYAVAGE